METQTTNSSNKTNAISYGSIVFAISGLVLIFLLVLGTWTDNRFGTHMVLNTDLTSGPNWFLCLVATIGVLVTIAGLVFLTLDALGIFKLDENKNRTLKIGAYLLMGSAAFAMALSSISFAAFNWQFFKSQIDNGISDTAIAMIAIAIIGITISLSYVVFGFFYELNTDDKLYLTLRNSSVGLIALGWLITNVCINSFGSMGGDANVLVNGLTDGKISLTALGTEMTNANATGLEIFQKVTGKNKPGVADVIWKYFIAIWDGTLSKLQITAINGILSSLNINFDAKLLNEAGGLIHILNYIGNDIVELGSGKEGMLMGVNNSFNAYMIFTLLVLGGTVGLPLYGYLTYNSASNDRPSIMYWGSIITIAAVFALYLFLALTPYMVKGEPEAGLIGMLLTGNYDPSIAPGLIALPGHDGGIHSAIVYFADEYNGTLVWWISEVLIIAIPIASYFGTMMYVNSVSK